MELSVSDPDPAPDPLVRITLPGKVEMVTSRLNMLLDKIGSHELIIQATKGEQVLGFPLAGQRIELAHNKVRRGEIYLLRVKKYVHKIK